MFKLLMLVSSFVSYNLIIPDKYKSNPQHFVPILFLQPNEVNIACGNDPGMVTFACETPKGLVIMPNPCDYPEAKDPNSYARLMCHEKAHILGWHHP